MHKPSLTKLSKINGFLCNKVIADCTKLLLMHLRSKLSCALNTENDKFSDTDKCLLFCQLVQTIADFVLFSSFLLIQIVGH